MSYVTSYLKRKKFKLNKKLLNTMFDFFFQRKCALLVKSNEFYMYVSLLLCNNILNFYLYTKKKTEHLYWNALNSSPV